MDGYETDRGFQGLTEVCSGHVSFIALARDVFGTSPDSLKESYPFFDGEYYHCTSGDLVPVLDLRNMLSYYSLVDSPIFFGVMAREYATPQTFVRALSSVHSQWYLPAFGPGGTLFTDLSSHEAPGGTMYLREITKRRQESGYGNLIRDVRITTEQSAGSAMTIPSSGSLG